jgi:hypothetical protein
MKFYALVTAVMVGVAVPLVANFSSPAAAPSPNIAKVVPLDGTFGDSDWMVTVSQQDGNYRYYGYNLKTSKSLELFGAKVTSQGSKRIYTWNNSGTKYRVTWQPQDQNYVRLQVISPNQTKVLNRLLSRQEDGC